jgi:hypothetical protein
MAGVNAGTRAAFLIDVQIDRVVTEDLSMPHSPRLNAGVL